MRPKILGLCIIGGASLLVVLMGCSGGILQRRTPMPDPTPTPFPFEVGDGGFLSQEPCGPPCFWGVVPGVTTQEELLGNLRARGIDRYFQVMELPQTDDIDYNSGNILFTLSRESKLITGIGYYIFPEIIVEDVLTVYGAPDAVSSTYTGSPEAEYSLHMQLYYDRLQTVVILKDQFVMAVQSHGYELTPQAPVYLISYFDRQGYLRQRDDSLDWEGYGEY